MELATATRSLGIQTTTAVAQQDTAVIPVLRGTIVNRTHGKRKKIYIYFPIFTKNIRSYLLWSPVLVEISMISKDGETMRGNIHAPIG